VRVSEVQRSPGRLFSGSCLTFIPDRCVSFPFVCPILRVCTSDVRERRAAKRLGELLPAAP